MGMGYAAASAHVIEPTVIERFLPGELKQLESFLESKKTSLAEVASCLDVASDFPYLEEEAIIQEVCQAVENFLIRLKEKIGIPVFIGYHDSESYGDRYDEVSEEFFYVHHSDIYEPKPLIEGLDIKQAYFVVYG